MADFSIEQWRTEVKTLVGRSRGWLAERWQRDVPYIVYGSLAGMALLPVVEAMAAAGPGNQWLIGAAIGNVLGNLGTNVVAALFAEWQGKAANANLETVADAATQTAPNNPQLRQAYDALIEQLAVIQDVQANLNEQEQQRFVARLAQETAGLGSSLSQMVATLGKIEQDTAHLPGIAASLQAIADPLDEAIHDYLQRLVNTCNRMTDLTALSLDTEDAAELTLDKVYVALNTTTPTKKEDGQDGPPLPAGRAVFESRRMVLLGDPGSGKSVFVRHLAAGLAQNNLGQGPSLPEIEGQMSCVPLLLTVRTLGPALAELKLDGLPQEKRQNQLRAVLDNQWQADLKELKAHKLAQQLDELFLRRQVMLIFDGLDEIAADLRPMLVAAIKAILEYYPNNIAYLLVTCRVRSYPADKPLLPRFAVHTLAPFTPEQIEAFIRAWYGAVPITGDKAARIRDFQQAVAIKDLAELAKNPMLLTTMALIHQSRATLPNQRVKLYKEAVEILIQRWQKVRGIAISPSLKTVLADEKLVRTLLERLGYEAHCLLRPGSANADLSRKDILDILANENYLQNEGPAAEFLAYIDHRAGLLVGRGGNETQNRPQLYTFPHRTFLEYLAGCHLIADKQADEIRDSYLELVGVGNDWYVAAQMGAEALLHNDNRKGDFLYLAKALCPRAEPTDEPGWRAVVWSAYLAMRMATREIEKFDREEGAAYLERLIAHLRAIVERGLLPTWERAEAGRFLSVLGDPRPGVTFTTAANGQKIPDIQWGEEVPAGTYPIGSDKPAWDSFEEQQISIDRPYRLACYPVTQFQFQCFEDAADFADRRWWAGMPERDGYGLVQEIWPAKFPFANHPRETINWYQAIAFCRWLSDKLGYEVDLPTEVEWEVAARYPHNRAYPWGDDEFDPAKANTYEGKMGQTTAVGLYPAGANQALGLYDLSGNVWEWCRNKWERPANTDIDKSGDHRTLRGGSWYDNDLDARAATRYSNYDPGIRGSWLGWRLARRSHLK